MFKQTRKIVLFIIVLCLGLTAFFPGCGNTSKDDVSQTSAAGESNGSNENITTAEKQLPVYKMNHLTGTQMFPGDTNLHETRIGRVLKEKFNFEISVKSFAGNWAEKLSLMLAAGDYGEMLWILQPDIFDKYLAAGVLLPLDDYLGSMPNFVERAKIQIPYWKMASKDGKLYKWEYGYNDSFELSAPQNDIGVRTDALEAMGWPNILSEDDYVNFLKDAMVKLPETNGKKSIAVVVPFAEPWGLPHMASKMFEKGKYNSVSFKGALWDHEKMEFEDFITNQYVKDSYKFFNRLHREGLLDREAFTDYQDQIVAKMSQGAALSVFYCNWQLPSVNANLTKAGMERQQFIAMPIKLNSQIANGDKRVFKIGTTRPTATMVLTKKCKDPERVMMVLDYIATEEGQMLAGWGQEGIDYEIVDGKRVVSEEYKKLTQSNSQYTFEQGIGCLAMFGLEWGLDKNKQNYSSQFDSSATYAVTTERQREAYGKLGWENHITPWYNNPDNPYEVFQAGIVGAITIPGDSEEGKIEAKMMEFRTTYPPKLILASSEEEFESIWENMVSAYNKLNPQKVIAEYNELYKSKMEMLK